jgi:Asp-tRNA(Asn)/Glu-tRNA(Gln) amidotransferase A subunit family amidase
MLPNMKTPVLLFVFFVLLFSTCGVRPPNTQSTPLDVVELTISDIHRAYKENLITSEQLVIAYIERIERMDKQINSITTINPEAIIIARQLDEEYKRTGTLRPLHGIPLIVKDNIETSGLPTTAGSLALQNFIPTNDAFIVDRLVKAGAIVLAKSNMAEWAFSPWSTISSTNGVTLNPYNSLYAPAGSSGGTGAAIAANFGTVGLGTDTGNSIRGPSSHCSLVGFRTTLGLVSRSGVVPLYLRNDVAGPMCRTVEDATRILDLIAGYDPLDQITLNSEGKIPDSYLQFLEKDGLKGARIGVLRTLSEADPDPEIKRLFEKALLDLEKLGAEIIDTLKIPDFDNLKQDQWCNDFKKDLESYLASNVRIDSVKTLADIIRVGSKRKQVTDRLVSSQNSQRQMNPVLQCLDAYTDDRRIAFRKAIEDQMDAMRLDAIVYPTWNNKPTKIGSNGDDYKGDNSRVISPPTGQPAFTVPMGFTSENIPAGLQFLGRMYAEPTLIRLTYSYEYGTKHRVPPVISK